MKGAFQVRDIQQFTKEYNLQCPMALQRLVYSGMPATVEHGKPRSATTFRLHCIAVQALPSSKAFASLEVPFTAGHESI